MQPINFDHWSEVVKNPIWYLELVPEFKKLADLHNTDREAYEKAKEEVYDFFEQKLISGEIALGDSGKDWDAERKPIDTVVIHHTSNLPGLRPARLSAIELVRLYAPYYFRPYLEQDKEIQGQPIWSNHVKDGVQNFWPYHWSIKEDGSVERLLEDNQIGWHAGKWEVNCRSVGICFDGDYEDSRPSDVMLSVSAQKINEHYPKSNVMGHSEINTNTTCPSKLFLNGWKQDLLNLFKS